MQHSKKIQLNFQDIMDIGTFVNVQQDIQGLPFSQNIFPFQFQKTFPKNSTLKKEE
jgi:hypothetical protein